MQSLDRNVSRRLFTLSLLLGLLVVSCGSDENTSTLASKRRPTPLPQNAAIDGSIPVSAAVTRSQYGGTWLASLSFVSHVDVRPEFDVSQVNWARSQSARLVSPDLNGCELTGVEIYFPNSDPTAEIHIWGWDSDSSCEAFLEKVLAAGVRWQLENLPGLYGETIRQAELQFAPANRLQ